MAYRIGIDVGGTFTDFALIDESGGRLWIGKELTTPDDPTRATVAGVRALLSTVEPAVEVAAGSVDEVVHGTTLATNVVLERKGEKVGLLTTRGFRDVLELGRQKRYELYDMYQTKPVPLIPRQRIREIDERLAFDGSVVRPLDEDSVRAAVQSLLDDEIRALAIVFLHSYANPQHERRAAEIVAELAPDLPVSLSCEVSPNLREYERSSTTAMNAYIAPAVRHYLHRLRGELQAIGLPDRVFIMQSGGGVALPEVMERFPVRMLESGPAAGAIMAGVYGRLTGHPNLIAFDMGGTTAKMSLIEDGQPELTSEFEVDKIRLKAGSGLPVMIPAIDLVEIGAGGGSIARPRLGVIAVGPDSAGAQPGPICYGRGGTEPTVTDANLVLGYLNPDYFLGGRMRLDLAGARQGIREKLADPLGLSIEEAAWGVHQMVTLNMAQAARAVSIDKGRDPREYAVIGFGGAGPIHAVRMAKQVGGTRVLLPPAAGVYSAIGLLSAALRFDFARTFVAALADTSIEAANQIYEELAATARETLSGAGVSGEPEYRAAAEMRYIGQGHEIRVLLPTPPFRADQVPEMRAAFEREYRRIYGYGDETLPVEVVTWHFSASIPRPAPERLDVQSPGAESPPRPSPLPEGEEASGSPLPRTGEGARGQRGRVRAVSPTALALKGRRPVYFPETGGFTDCPIYDRYQLTEGMSLAGPAIIEERESTIVILPDCTAEVDTFGNVIVTLPVGDEAADHS